jgi:hypothetical protein
VIRRTLALVLMTWSLLVVASSASAQLVAAKDGPVVYGHHHLNVTSVEPQKKFFVDALGGTAIKIGTNNLVLRAESPSRRREGQSERLQDGHGHRGRRPRRHR